MGRRRCGLREAAAAVCGWTASGHRTRAIAMEPRARPALARSEFWRLARATGGRAGIVAALDSARQAFGASLRGSARAGARAEDKTHGFKTVQDPMKTKDDRNTEARQEAGSWTTEHFDMTTIAARSVPLTPSGPTAHG